jgi:hypothetical protein
MHVCATDLYLAVNTAPMPFRILLTCDVATIAMMDPTILRRTWSCVLQSVSAGSRTHDLKIGTASFDRLTIYVTGALTRILVQ